ncbi:unnamed protein product [Ranitomeya imitator]|uniref:Uncharacterized protein n=1 Tax=Ranitomeya imitator TaxID=111125 RepID=A0ABN9LP16_9NEOB|nr:unnamed protein product [Ranitomeya imitator]
MVGERNYYADLNSFMDLYFMNLNYRVLQDNEVNKVYLVHRGLLDLKDLLDFPFLENLVVRDSKAIKVTLDCQEEWVLRGKMGLSDPEVHLGQWEDQEFREHQVQVECPENKEIMVYP